MSSIMLPHTGKSHGTGSASRTRCVCGSSAISAAKSANSWAQPAEGANPIGVVQWSGNRAASAWR
eukprot:3575832-Heterocapsa_arctica.AAC.1